MQTSPTSNCDATSNKENMNALNSAVDPGSPSLLPSFQPVTTPPPSMPRFWAATVLLHPFSPPLSTDPAPDNPFFQLCVADVAYSTGAAHYPCDFRFSIPMRF